MVEPAAAPADGDHRGVAPQPARVELADAPGVGSLPPVPGRQLPGPGQRRVKGEDRHAVDDRPPAVLAAVEVGDAQGGGRDRDAVDGPRAVLIAHGVGQLPTGAGGDQLIAVGGAVGGPRGEHADELAHLIGPVLGGGGAEQGHRVLG
jgi:hypothetical protein